MAAAALVHMQQLDSVNTDELSELSAEQQQSDLPAATGTTSGSSSPKQALPVRLHRLVLRVKSWLWNLIEELFEVRSHF